MEWLKELIKSYVSEDKLEEVVESFKKEFPKHAALKSDFNSVKGELDTANTTLSTLTNQLEEMKKGTGNSEALQKQLTDATAELEKVKSESSKRESNYIKMEKLKAGLSKKFNADSVDLLANTFNLDDLILNEAGEIVDFESKVTKLATDRPSLAIKVDVNSNTPGDKDTNTLETDYSKMTDEQYYAAKAAEGSK